MFLDIVIYNQTKLEYSLNWLKKKGVPIGSKDFTDFNKYINAKLQCPFIIVCFTALFLEAFINDYARRQSSQKYAKNYLDKIDFVSKWLIVPKLFTKTDKSISSQSIDFLRKLNKLRNDIVHYKTTEFDPQKDDLNVKEFKELNELALNCLSGITLMLNQIKIIGEDKVAEQLSNYVNRNINP